MEIIILKLSDASNKNVTFRIDAEFFQKKYLKALDMIYSNKFSLIEDISSWVTQGPNPVFSEEGIPCLTGRNINKGDVKYINSDLVSDDEYERLSRYQLEVGDSLITLKGKGSIGKIGFVTKIKKAIFSRDIGIIRPSTINPGYLNIFIMSKYGKLLVDRGETGGTGQSTLTTGYLKSMPIPRFKNLEASIGNILTDIEQLKDHSEEHYSLAKTLLLKELNLLHWKPKHKLTFIKNFSDTQQAERFDAEYYQPKYEEIIRTIKAYKGGWDTLSNLVYVKKCIEVGSDEYRDNGIPFVRVSNISPFEITKEKYISNELYESLALNENDISFEKSRNHQPKKGEILFSKDGTPGIAYHLNTNVSRMIPSGGILRLKRKSEKINEEYLTLVLNSILVQEQVNRDVGGSIILHWRPDQIKKVVIPILPQDIQNEIKHKVTESFQLRKQSKHLLESAKKAVEMAIEQDEDKAIEWLEKEMDSVSEM